MAGNVSIKLSVDGTAAVKAALEGFSQAGTDATAKVRASLEALSAGDISGKFADQLKAAAIKVAAAQQALAAVPAGDTSALAAAQQKVTAATDAYSAALARKRAAIVPTAAAEQTLAKAMSDVSDAEKLGAISTTEAAAARARAQSGYDKTILSMKEVTTTSGAAAANMRGLGIQFVQGFSGIATGQPVLTTFIQQGHQVVDQSLAMGTGFGGIATAAKGLVSAIGGLPVLLGAAVVGGLAAAGAAANENANHLGELRQQLRLTHDDYAALADTVVASSKRVAASTNLTRTAAEDIGKSIASSKYLGSFAGDLDDLTKAAANYARVAGGDGAAAGKLFRQAIDEPAAAASSLAAAGLPAMTAALLRTITTLDASGEHAKASALVLDTLRTSFKGATDDVSPLSKAMTELSNAFSATGANGKSFASEIGTFVTNDLATFLTQLTDLVHKAQDLRDWIGKGSSPIIDQNTGKPTNGITLPDGLSNKVYSIAEANSISAEIADLATRIIGRGEKSGGQYAADGSVLTSPKGAQGLMQMMPGTAAGQDINPGGRLDPTKLDDNILLGLRYLSQLGQQFHGNEQQIAAAYNAGPGRLTDVLNGKATLPGETARYVKDVTGSPFAAPSAASPGSVALPTIDVTASKKLPDSVERALAPFTKLGSEGTPEATQAAASADIAKYTAAINDLRAAGETTGPTMDRLQQLLFKARGEFANAISPINAVTRGISDQLAPLLAESGAARAVAEAINAQVLAARGNKVTDGQAEAAKAAVLRNLAAAFNDVVAGTDRSTAANLRIAGTLDQGAGSFVQATNREKALAQAREDFLPGPEQTAAVERYTKALNGQSASVADLASVQKSFDQRDQLAVLQLETTSLGQNADLRDKEIALLQAKQALIRQGADLDSDASKANLANVAAISNATAALKGQQAAYSELTGFIDNTFSTISDSIVSAFATGQQEAVRFKDVAASVIKAVEAEALKLALINPLKNWLLGDDGKSPTLTSVGGIIGKLFGSDGAASITGSAGSTGAAALASAFDGAGTTLSGSGSSFNDSLSLGTVVKGVELGEKALGGGGESLGGGLIAGLADKFTDAVTSALGNSTQALNLAADAGGNLGNAGILGASVSNAIGLSDETATLVAGAAGKVADALPYIGTAITVITDLIQGNYRGAGLVAGGAGLGAAIGSIIPGLGTALGAAVGATIGGLVDAFLPNHPKHPFEDVELNVAGGKLATGKSDGQLADVAGLVAGTQNYVDNINHYLDSVGVKIATADGNIGRIGQGITGLAQTLNPSSTFNRLDFTNATPDDRSNFSIAKSALDGMKFDTPQALADELAKIGAFADAATALGVQLSSVGKDLTDIGIASVAAGGTKATSTVTDSSGLSITFLSDLKTALSNDLPRQRYADIAGIDAEIQKVSDFFSGTLPSLLTPMKVTQSTIQDQYNAIRNQYAVAAQQSKNYGLDNTAVLRDAMDRSLAILMEPVTRSLNTAAAAVAGRFASLAYGTVGSGAAANTNLMYTQANERAAFDDSWRQAWGDSVTASDAYKSALQQLIDTQNLEAEATRQQMALAREQGLASLAASEADFAKRAGMDSLAQQLSAYDAKAAVETDTFIASWRAYYGQYAAVGDDFQNQMIALYKAHYAERLQIESDYNTTSNAALKTAQGSVGSLFTSLKDYALKLQTGSQSALSPTAQYDLAKSQFNAVAGAAQAGDATSASQLTTYADALLTTSRAMFDTGIGYANDYNAVIDAIQGVSMVPDALTQSFITQNTQSQTDQLVQTLQDTSTGLRSEIAALRREVQGLSRQMAA